MEKNIHLGIGHYWIGYKDGVNSVISRNVRALMKIDPALKITLFGKLSPDFNHFIKPSTENIGYLNIDEFDPDFACSHFGGKPISEQKVQDYIW
ncbi:hypothetical protein H5U35_00045, partial [Candidatus Aerophobetes bacterium]|nr:hypothetical protein [Candidatus Aerophobetes bacterium]